MILRFWPFFISTKSSESAPFIYSSLGFFSSTVVPGLLVWQMVSHQFMCFRLASPCWACCAIGVHGCMGCALYVLVFAWFFTTNWVTLIFLINEKVKAFALILEKWDHTFKNIVENKIKVFERTALWMVHESSGGIYAWDETKFLLVLTSY